MAGEIVEAGRLDFIQMIQNAGLVGADGAAGARIADVAGMAGKEDARVELHHLGDGIHAAQDTFI